VLELAEEVEDMLVQPIIVARVYSADAFLRLSRSTNFAKEALKKKSGNKN